MSLLDPGRPSGEKMKITAVETHMVRVKFDMGATPRAFPGAT